MTDSDIQRTPDTLENILKCCNFFNTTLRTVILHDKNTTFCNAMWNTITKEICCIGTKYVKSTLNCIFAQICYKYAKWFQHEIKTGYLTTRQRHHVRHVSKHTQITECRENHHSHATINNFIYCLAHTCTSSVFLFTNTIWHIIVNSCIVNLSHILLSHSTGYDDLTLVFLWVLSEGSSPTLASPVPDTETPGVCNTNSYTLYYMKITRHSDTSVEHCQLPRTLIPSDYRQAGKVLHS